MKKNAREARLSLTKATSAVILGLALAATPTFALAAQDPAATQTASADGAQAQAGAADATTNDNLHDALQDRSITEINLAVAGTWDPKPWYVPAEGHIENVTVDRDLTINGYSAETGQNTNYLNDTVFTVTAGHTLTLNNVNLYNNPLTSASLTSITVQSGGKLVTKGVGDIISNGGTSGEAIAIKLESGSSAELGAAPSGFSWGNNYAGNYGSSFAVSADENTDLKITNGKFIEENGRGEAITSSGRVTIDPDESAGYYVATGSEDLPAEVFGTVQLRGENAVLVAKNTQFGFNEGNGDRENMGVSGNISLVDGAKAYLTDVYSSSSIISSNQDAVSAIDVDAKSVVYTQDNTWDQSIAPAGIMTTQGDLPGFGGFRSFYEGDHLTKNQYYVEALNKGANNAVENTTGLFQIKKGQEFNDLETQVNATTDDLKATVSGSGNSLTAKAELPLGKSNVYGKYEITHYYATTGITGDGHVYEVSAVHNLQAGWDVSKYRSGSEYTAPEGDGQANSGVEGDIAPAGYVFAGWYTKGGDLRTGGASNDWGSSVEGIAALQKAEDPASAHELGENEKTGYAYAKFVPATLLEAGTQFKSNGNQSKLRFLMALDSYNYNGIGFTVTDADGNKLGNDQDLTSTMAYDYMLAEKGGKPDQEVYASEVFVTDENLPLLLARVSLTNLAADYSGTVKVTGYWITPDGTKVSGKTITVKVDGKGGVTATKQADSSLAGSANASN